MTTSPATIGIVGGAGPMAGALLMQRIIEVCQSKYLCVNDFDFPKIVLLSYPFSEMLKPDSEDQRESEVARELKETLTFLIASGADYVGIACNTLHTFLDGVTDQLTNMVELVCNELTHRRCTNALLLCTSTSSQRRLYQTPCRSLSPAAQAVVDEIIRAVLSGIFSVRERDLLYELICDQQNVDTVILGCSELSVLDATYSLSSDLEVVDPLTILAEELCRRAFGARTLP